MPINRIRMAWCLAAAAVTCVGSAQATVLVPGTLDELVRDARVVVVGRVVEVRAQWAEGRRRVESVVVVEANGYLKGDFGPRLAFKVPGGEIGRYRSVTVGAPVFRDGDEVVLFLDADGPALPHLVGFSQGVLRIVRDRLTGRAMVLAPPADAAGTAPQAVTRGDASRTPAAIDAFAARVRAMVAAASQPRDRDSAGGRQPRVIRGGARGQ
ncbi:MAG: hypothetical protein IMZ67_03400 [Acidobacteria bacterium]|nr:hypothetical protein [Acidobacteriota bacterium]